MCSLPTSSPLQSPPDDATSHPPSHHAFPRPTAPTPASIPFTSRPACPAPPYRQPPALPVPPHAQRQGPLPSGCPTHLGPQQRVAPSLGLPSMQITSLWTPTVPQSPHTTRSNLSSLPQSCFFLGFPRLAGPTLHAGTPADTNTCSHSLPLASHPLQPLPRPWQPELSNMAASLHFQGHC